MYIYIHMYIAYINEPLVWGPHGVPLSGHGGGPGVIFANSLKCKFVFCKPEGCFYIHDRVGLFSSARFSHRVKD